MAHHWQYVVLHLNQGECRARDLDVDGRHGGNGVAHMADLVNTQHGAIHLAQTVVLGARNIGMGDNRMHAGQGAGRIDVDVQKAGVGMGAAQNGPDQLAFLHAVGQKARIARELGGCIWPNL